MYSVKTIILQKLITIKNKNLKVNIHIVLFIVNKVILKYSNIYSINLESYFFYLP